MITETDLYKGVDAYKAFKAYSSAARTGLSGQLKRRMVDLKGEQK